MKASCLAPLGRSRARGRDIQQSSSARPNPLESVCPCVVVRVTTACLHSYFVCPKAAFFCALSRTATLHGDALLPKASLLHPGIQFLGAVYAQPRIESRHITSPSQGQGLLSPLTFLSRGPGCHLRGLAAGVSLTCLSSCPGPLQPPPPLLSGNAGRCNLLCSHLLADALAPATASNCTFVCFVRPRSHAGRHPRLPPSPPPPPPHPPPRTPTIHNPLRHLASCFDCHPNYRSGRSLPQNYGSICRYYRPYQDTLALTHVVAHVRHALPSSPMPCGP